MQLSITSLLLLLLVCCSCGFPTARAQQEGNILTGIVRNDFGFFDINPATDRANFEPLIRPNSTTWPPQRRLVTYGRYGSSKAVFIGGESYTRGQYVLTTLLDKDGQMDHIEVNMTFPGDINYLWLLTADSLNSKLYAFTQAITQSEFEIRLYEVHAGTGATTLLETYPHDLLCQDLLYGGVTTEPFTQEMLFYASCNLSLWKTWRISIRSAGKLIDHRTFTQRMDAPVLSSDLKTFYSFDGPGLLFKAVDTTTGQVTRSKKSSISWTVQKNVAALDDHTGRYFASGSLFGGPAHLLIFDVNSMELQSRPYTSFSRYYDAWDLLFIPESF